MIDAIARFFDWLFSAPEQVAAETPAVVEPRQVGTMLPRGPGPYGDRMPARAPRVYCPVCGRDVAITSDGITFDHMTRPGTLDRTRHRVRIIDGAEVVVNGVDTPSARPAS